MNGFQCFTPFDTHFQMRHFLNNNLKFYYTYSSAYIEVDINLSLHRKFSKIMLKITKIRFHETFGGWFGPYV